MFTILSCQKILEFIEVIDTTSIAKQNNTKF